MFIHQYDQVILTTPEICLIYLCLKMRAIENESYVLMGVAITTGLHRKVTNPQLHVASSHFCRSEWFFHHLSGAPGMPQGSMTSDGALGMMMRLKNDDEDDEVGF